MNTIQALKEIRSNEAALKENLLKTDQVQALLGTLIDVLDKELDPKSVHGLRFEKFKAEMGSRLTTLWSTPAGYPTDRLWNSQFEPLLSFLEQHEATKTLKARFKDKDHFFEVRCRDEDTHILIGERDGNPEKAHIILDGQTGEARVENQGVTDRLVRKLNAVFTLQNGDRIRTTRKFSVK